MDSPIAYGTDVTRAKAILEVAEEKMAEEVNGKKDRRVTLIIIGQVHCHFFFLIETFTSVFSSLPEICLISWPNDYPGVKTVIAYLC